MKEMTIDGTVYVPKSEAVVNLEWQGETELSAPLIGKPVIVRTRNEGVNAGILVAADQTGCMLQNCRRLWKHTPADENLSWYEGVAIAGINKDSIVSPTAKIKLIIEDYSLTLCTDGAYTTIMEAIPNAQA